MYVGLNVRCLIFLRLWPKSETIQNFSKHTINKISRQFVLRIWVVPCGQGDEKTCYNCLSTTHIFQLRTHLKMIDYYDRS